MKNPFIKTAVGIDIADHTIEVVELEKKGKQFFVCGMNKRTLPDGVVTRGRIQDPDKLAAALKEVFKNAKPEAMAPTHIVFGLPESQVYTHVATLPVHEKSERAYVVQTEAEQSIPVPKRDVVFDYKVLKEEKKGTEVLIVASSRDVVQEWQLFFKKLKIELAICDIETLAVFRDLFATPPKKPVCVVDIGAESTTISIFNKNGLHYSYSIKRAGDTFTEAVAEKLGVAEKDAEKAKKKVRLADKKDPAAKVVAAGLGLIAKEIKSAGVYYKRTHKDTVSEVVLIGGSSKLKGIVDLLTKQLDVPVRLGRSVVLEKKIPLDYVEAVGLALRGIDKKWQEHDPSIPLVDTSVGKKKKKNTKNTKRKINNQKSTIKNQSSVVSTADITHRAKLRKQKVMLGILFVGAILVIGGSYWYQGYQREQKEARLAAATASFTEVQTLEVTVPVAVNPAEYTTDRVRGRLVAHEIPAAGGYNEAVAMSRIIVSKSTDKGEILWETPVSASRPEDVSFPVTIDWVVYFEEDANRLFVEHLDRINKNKIEYALSNIVKMEVTSTENPAIYQLQGLVTLTLNEFIDVGAGVMGTTGINGSGEEPSVSDETIEIVQIEILETGIGWLNSREGPGTGNPIVRRVNVGEVYTELEREAGWVHLQLDEATTAWVLSTYTKILQ